ncbi:MAG: ABC transporter ATP-binding protein, partial [Alphaproteobacteria bacterium]
MSDIQISGLTKRFGNAAVLQELDLTVRDGEFLTLLGASGCGKSTLLKLIAGLDTPDTGTIRMGDRDLLALSPSARDCAMVFQSYALYPHMTVRENISMPLVMRGLGFWGRLPGARLVSPGVRRRLADIHASAHEVARRLAIDGLLDRKPAHLSGGQRQRVALARAMVRHPSVFLFDEPLSNLDANLRHALRAEIRQLHDQLGVTFIYVTHDQHEAMSMSDRVAVMREGRILQVAPPEDLYMRPQSLEV